MLKSIQRFFDGKLRPRGGGGVTSEEVTKRTLRLATAALLIEVSRADKLMKEEERGIVTAAVEKTFGLGPDETAELVGMAEEEVRGAVSLYQFTHLVDKGYAYGEKLHIVELLWRVVFADSVMERHEEHIVRRIADLLHVTHGDFIEAKLRARKSG